MDEVVHNKVEHGDFQTPASLAIRLAAILKQSSFRPATIIEPTCGTGALLSASAAAFPRAQRFVGYDINHDYIQVARSTFPVSQRDRLIAERRNVFDIDWRAEFRSAVDPILVVGNPPWVTNSELGRRDATNLPAKRNRTGTSGLDALTGKSNFDISEWILFEILHALQGRAGTLAMICKVAVARKIVRRAAENDLKISRATMWLIDAKEQFNVSVGACFFVVETGRAHWSKDCEVFETIDSPHPVRRFGMRDGSLVTDVDAFEASAEFLGASPCRWRSGAKHDAARIMEFVVTPEGTRNGVGECVELEPDHLFPLLKSSDVAQGRTTVSSRRVLLTQRTVGDNTSVLASTAPKTWAYLQSHAEVLDGRASSIYRNRSRFAVFGVGPYTFTPWKVAISGLYKRLGFRLVGPADGRPVVFDDTVYFLPCPSREAADLLLQVLNSPASQEALRAIVFWDSKRPITVDVLQRLDLNRIAESMGRGEEFRMRLRSDPASEILDGQLSLFA